MKYQFDACLGSRVRSISRKLDSIYRKHLGTSPVTESQLSILMSLYKIGPVEQNQIAQILNLERSSLSRNLIRLVNAGFLEKTGASNRPKIALTESGVQLVDRLTPIWEMAMDEIHAVLSWYDLKGFGKFETKIKEL